MRSTLCAALLVVCGGTALVSAAPPPPPPLTFTLNERKACAIPTILHNARADGGYIDVQTSTPGDAVNVAMTGTVAAEACPGHDSLGRFCIYVDQEFEVTSSDDKIKKVKLTLDSALIGFLRSHGNSTACIKEAVAWFGTTENPMLTTAYAPTCVSGGGNKSCNWKNAPQDITLAVGKYSLHGKFVIEAAVPSTLNICNGPAAADFSPDVVLPPEFVHEHDAFQGIAKKDFGFKFSLTAAKPDEPPAKDAKTAYHIRTLRRSQSVQQTGHVVSGPVMYAR